MNKTTLVLSFFVIVLVFVGGWVLINSPKVVSNTTPIVLEDNPLKYIENSNPVSVSDPERFVTQQNTQVLTSTSPEQFVSNETFLDKKIVIPSISNNSGKFLTNDGLRLFWETVSSSVIDVNGVGDGNLYSLGWANSTDKWLKSIVPNVDNLIYLGNGGLKFAGVFTNGLWVSQINPLSPETYVSFPYGFILPSNRQAIFGDSGNASIDYNDTYLKFFTSGWGFHFNAPVIVDSNIYQNGFNVCDTSGNCATPVSNSWDYNVIDMNRIKFQLDSNIVSYFGYIDENGSNRWETHTPDLNIQVDVNVCTGGGSDLNSGLVFYADFETGAVDLSNNEWPITETGSPTYPAGGLIGNAMYLDNDYITIENQLLQQDANWTWNGWIKNNITSDKDIFSNGYASNEYLFFLAGGGSCNFFEAPSVGNAGACAGTMNNGLWHMVTYTFNASTGEMCSYEEGSVTDCSTLSWSASSTAYANIGYSPDIGRTMVGYFDEWGVWDRVLDESELSSLYNGGNALAFSEFGTGDINCTIETEYIIEKGANSSITQTASGDINYYVEDFNTQNHRFHGNVIPDGNNIYSLGDENNLWADIWLGQNTIHIGNSSIGTDENGNFVFTTAHAGELTVCEILGGTLMPNNECIYDKLEDAINNYSTKAKSSGGFTGEIQVLNNCSFDWGLIKLGCESSIMRFENGVLIGVN